MGFAVLVATIVAALLAMILMAFLGLFHTRSLPMISGTIPALSVS
jgi:hypothetical protein